MSCTISTSNNAADVWMIRNSIFRWLNRILAQRFPEDKEFLDAMRTAEIFNGIAIHSVQEQDSQLADQIVLRLEVISEEISNGLHDLTDDNQKLCTVLQKECEQSFDELSLILSRWRPTRTLNGLNKISEQVAAPNP
jgi:hypothetical protein